MFIRTFWEVRAYHITECYERNKVENEGRKARLAKARTGESLGYVSVHAAVDWRKTSKGRMRVVPLLDNEWRQSTCLGTTARLSM